MSHDLRHRIAKALVDIHAVGFVPDKPIRFKSGILSPIYIDNRSLAFHPAEWHAVIEGFQALVEYSGLEYDVLAGVAVGGVPHSSALAYLMGTPAVFVRKEAKGHGTQKLVEGGDVNRKRVLLVEDLVTTGGSSLTAVNALREEGALVTHMLAIVSYGFSESAQAFADANVELRTLTDFEAIVYEAERAKTLAADSVQRVQDWFSDPHGWGRKYGHE